MIQTYGKATPHISNHWIHSMLSKFQLNGFFFSTDNCQGDCLSDTLDETSATSPLALASSTESTASRKYGNVFHFTSFAFAFLFLAGRATK